MSARAPASECTWHYRAALFAAAVITLSCARANSQAAAERSFGNPSADAVEPCAPAPDTRTPLSLSQAIDLALCNNPDVAVAWANIRAQAAALGEARSAYWPNLSVSASELNERTGYPGTGVPAGNTTAKTIYGSLDWRLFDFGVRASRYRAAESLLTAAIATRDATIQQVLGTVIQAYFDAITANAVVTDRTESESVARKTLDSARRRLAGGDAAQNDVLQATAALERARLDHNRAEADDEKAVAVLAYSLGLPAGSTILLADSVNARSSIQESDLTAWLHATERRHPAILAARAAVQAAREDVASARSADRPTIDLTANYYENGFPNQGLTSTNLRAATVGITVTVPLFDGFLTHYNVEQAKATVEVREGQLRQVRQATLMAVVQAYADSHSALGNVNMSEDLLTAAQAALESSQRRYLQGAADIVELLSAQEALADARMELTRSLADWRADRLRLLASAGMLERTDIAN